MPKNPSPYILHIIDAATQINEYLEGMNLVGFGENKLKQDAVIRNLEVIGEACAKLEENFKATHAHIPWTQIVGMRNKLTHEYWDIDLDIVWQAATVEAQGLKKQLLELMTELGK